MERQILVDNSFPIEQSRCKRFRTSRGFYEDGAPCSTTPFFVPSEFIFEIFFFRQLFSSIVTEHAKNGNGSMHVTLFHNVSRRMEHILALDRGVEQEKHLCFFGRRNAFKHEWVTWKNVYDELLEVGHRRISMTFAERLYHALDDDKSCIFARIWFYFVMATTLLNLSDIIEPGFPAWFIENTFHVNTGDARYLFSTSCIYVFTVDYGAKLLLVPFIRLHVLDLETFRQSVANVNSLGLIKFSIRQRLLHFMCKGLHLADLIAILPFWLGAIFGKLGVNMSFLRIVRLARIFKVVKTVQHLNLLRILLTTLLKSASMVFLLLAIMGVIGLAVGYVFHQFETHDAAFQTVPRACYWVVAHLIGVRDGPFCHGVVFSKLGLLIYAWLMSFKAVLWVVPMASVELYFVEEESRVTNAEDMKKDLNSTLFQGKAEVLFTSVNSREGGSWIGVQGLASGRLHVADSSGKVSTTAFGLPLFEATLVDVPGMSVQFRRTGICATPVTLILQLSWDPSADMKLFFPRMPHGRLKLCVLDLVGSTDSDPRFSIDVPTESFEYTSFMLQRGEEVQIDIKWASGAAASREPERKNEASVALLQEQSTLLSERALQLDSLQAALTGEPLHAQMNSREESTASSMIRSFFGF